MKLIKWSYLPFLQLACACANMALTIGTNAYVVHIMLKLEDKIDKRFDKMLDDRIKLFEGHFDKLNKNLIRVENKHSRSNEPNQ